MNRTGTYVAFDGQGSTDPTESDIHYFNLLKAWNKSGSIVLGLLIHMKKLIRYVIAHQKQRF